MLTAKVAILNKVYNEMWRLRNIAATLSSSRSYALWDVIENETLFQNQQGTKQQTMLMGTSTSMIPGCYYKENGQKRNDCKARSMFADVTYSMNMKMTFNQYRGCQTVFDALTNKIWCSTNEVNTANVQVSTANSPVSTTDTPDKTANLSDATVYAFLANQPNGSQLVHKDLEQIHEDNLEEMEMDLKWQLALLSMRARRYFQRTGKKITINGSDTARYDKFKVECFNYLEVAFWKSTCFVRDLQGNYLLTGNHGSDLYIISLQETTSSTPICLTVKASATQAWLWHRRLSHLNFDYINLLSKKDIVIGLPKLKYVKDQLCSSCEVSKAKWSSFKTKTVPSSKGRLNLLHIDLCGPMRVASINRKKYIMVIVDDYSRYTWTLFLCSKDETPEVLKDFLTMIQRNLQALVISVRTNRGTEFLNKTLNAFFKEEGIKHQTFTPRTPEQNGIVETQKRTLVEAA
ncbi:retrovirus-related pol polyprotein from transposon TNT 1-94 [Tanacetum coccineum]|uniref:Retrovirus-related pol polyprotein from transposon TNT 1-94 n=1 Tax=Tanacetum coccineum TaxID=301880 RepID=A0ABQ4YCM3_9ASTR